MQGLRLFILCLFIWVTLCPLCCWCAVLKCSDSRRRTQHHPTEPSPMSRLTTRRKMSKPPFWAFPLVSASTWLGNWSFSDLDLVRNQLIFPQWRSSGYWLIGSSSANRDMAEWSLTKPFRKFIARGACIIGQFYWQWIFRFISDLAAQKLWPFFLIGCFITTLFFNISFYQFVRRKEHHSNICIYFSFVITIIGGLSLLMIAVFDNIDFKHLHDVFVTVFMWDLLVFSWGVLAFQFTDNY